MRSWCAKGKSWADALRGSGNGMPARECVGGLLGSPRAPQFASRRCAIEAY